MKQYKGIRTSFLITDEMDDRLDALAKKVGRTRSDLIRSALQRMLDTPYEIWHRDEKVSHT